MLWIVHRSPQLRTALARLAAAGEDAFLGAPEDPGFDAAPAADVVLLGLAEDFESELQFAHRARGRLPDAAWILLAEPDRVADARRLFDRLEPEVMGYPPEAAVLRESIRSAPRRRRREPLPLSLRPFRDALNERFARWFADLELPELFRALDPHLAHVPVLILGEPGTGRALLARYIHAFGSPAAGGFTEVICTAGTSPAELREAVGVASRGTSTRPAGTLCLTDLDRLGSATQRWVQRWIEFEPPDESAREGLARWIGTARDAAAVEPSLRQVLAGLCLRIPPLRERIQSVVSFTHATAREWCRARGERNREFHAGAIAVLEEYPWPGNLRELEAVIVQTLSAGAADPIRAADLQLEGARFAPLAGQPGSSDDAVLEPVPEWIVDASAEPSAEPTLETVLLEEPEETPEASLPIIEAEALEAAPRAIPDPSLRRLAGAVAHEVRNPLSSIRTFAQLLPERYRDSEFRQRFAEIVNRDVMRIEEVVTRLGRLASLTEPDLEKVDITALLEEILLERADAIRGRRLLVLRELETQQPFAIGDRDQLRFAFEALVNGSLSLVPDRGDVFIASRYHGSGPHGGASARILLRLRPPERPAPAGDEPTVAGPAVAPAENALELAITETIIRGHGGAFAVDTSDRDEVVIILDIPA